MGKYFTSIGDLVGKIILRQSGPKTTSCKSQSIKNWFRLVKTASNLLNRIEKIVLKCCSGELFMAQTADG